MLKQPDFITQKRIRDLENKIAELKKKDHEPKKNKDQFTHIIQLLILDYLGLVDRKITNKLNAVFIAPIIRRDQEKTRQLLSRISEGKNLRNLKIILEHFEKTNQSDIAQLVKKDIDRLKQRKK